jgi:transketolase
MFAAHHQLDNLIAIVDANGRQALGKTRDILHIDDTWQEHPSCGITDKFRAFGWTAGVHYPGKDKAGATVPVSPAHIRGEYVPKCNILRDNAPFVLVCYTTFGAGVSFMQNEQTVKWHYAPLTEAEYKAAREEVENA